MIFPYFVKYTFQNHNKSILFSNLKFNERSSCSTTKEIPLVQWNLKSSLPCSQETATCPHPKPDESSKQVSQTYFNIVFPTMSRVSLWSVLSRNFCLFHLAVVVQLFTKFQPFYATEDSLPRLQVPTTCPYPDPYETSPHRYIMCL
jgi:hypothetical protein